MDEVMNKLDAYVARLRKQGMKLPTHLCKKIPHFGAISAASGVDLKFFTEQRYRNRISLAVDEVGVETNWKLQQSMRKEYNEASLATYILDLKKKGLKLPEDPLKRGRVFYSQVEVEAGLWRKMLTDVKVSRTGEHDSKLLTMIEDAVPALGMEVRLLRTPTEPAGTRITYKQLLASGTAQRKQELEGHKSAQQQVYNTRWALKYFRRSLDLSENTPAGHELFDEFDANLQIVLDKVHDEDTRKKVQTEVRWWSGYYQKLLKAGFVPEDINDAIVYLVDASGLPISILSKLIGVRENALYAWHQGSRTPSMLSKDVLTRMETLFKLPGGALLSRVPGQHGGLRFRRDQLPEILREDKNLMKKVIKHLPAEFCVLPTDKQHDIVEDIRKNIAGYDSDFTRMMRALRESPYRLKELPIRLSEEKEEFFAFKTMERQPLGMRRGQRWRDTTKKKADQDMSSLFGALRLPSEAAVVCLRGLGIETERLTMAFIVCPLIIDWYLRFLGEARTQYTQYHLDLIGSYIEMLEPGTGWLRQKPQLAGRLTPVSLGDTELVSPDFITRAISDWNGVCDGAIEQLKALRTELRPLAKVSRDPFSRIEGIVEMDDPMEATRMLIDGMRRAWPNPKTTPMRYHVAVRNTALILIFCLTGFRRLTASMLNYTGEESGHLFMRGGKYVLHVPRGLFKVENSPYFGPPNARRDYHMTIPNVFGFNEVMSKYLNESRQWLFERYHAGSVEKALFITASGAKTVRLAEDRITKIYNCETETHLVENKWRGTGIARVARHGPHSARHIRGTAVIKKTGSTQMAGDANHNSEETARKHYTRFLPEDRSRRVNKILFGGDEK
jgi:hypothetical protein